MAIEKESRKIERVNVTPLRNERNEKMSESLSDLAADLPREISQLIRTEVELGKSEIRDKAKQAQKGVTSFGIGGGMLFYGVMALTAFAVIVLAYLMPLWLSALIVGIVLCGIGAAFLARGRKEMQSDNLKPEQTMESLKDDRQLLQRRKERKYG